MIQELLMASNSVKALGTLLKTAQTLSNYNEIVQAVSEVNTKLMDANSVALASQERQSLLTKRVSDLEHEIQLLQKWDAELSRYELKQISPGVFAYALRSGKENGEPPHYLCANCFTKRQKSFLQAINSGQCHCQNCSSVLNTYDQQAPGSVSSDFDPYRDSGGWMSR